MKQSLVISFLLLVTAIMAAPKYRGESYGDGDDILRKVSDKLNSYTTISYNYFRSINYFSESYHSELTEATFLDFQSSDSILGFKYQVENEHYKLVYNGAESFLLNRKEKSIRVNYKPTLNDFASLSFLVNSIVTLKRVLPGLITDKNVVKTLTDTIIGNISFYLVSFVLHDKTNDGLGSFSVTTVKRDFLYRVIIDKETFLPFQVIQTNNVEPKDYMLTSFSNISSGDVPSELSWYYSTYGKDYKPAAEAKEVLIKQGTLAPDWTLRYTGGNERVVLKKLRGSVILLEFWIKNCGYCIAAVPKLNSLMEKYRSERFQVIGVNAHDGKEGVDNFYERTKPNFKTALDSQGVTADYGVQAFPTVVLLDKKGIVLYSGGYDLAKLERLIKGALK